MQKTLPAFLAILPLACACQQRHGGDGGASAAPRTTAAEQARCLPGERAYISMRLRGAIEADVDARGGTLACEGGERPDGRGLRVSFVVPAAGATPSLRVVFGLDAAPRRDAVGPLPTNLTVIVEGQQRVYATQGDQRCSIEALSQQAIGDAGQYRVAARGSCIDPATTLDGAERLYVDRFDFAGIASFTTEAGGDATRT